MTDKKKSDSKISTDETSIPTMSEDSSALGAIKINLNVIASIVRLAALKVEGVAAVGGGFVDKVAGMFPAKKDGGIGIRVEEDSNENYQITIRVILEFGVNLAKTAYEIQNATREQVVKMTNKQVSNVDVIIDEVRMPESRSNNDDNWNAPETD